MRKHVYVVCTWTKAFAIEKITHNTHIQNISLKKNRKENLNFKFSVIINLMNFLLLLLISAVSLKDLKISVPEAVAVGDTVTIACYYDLENVNKKISQNEKKTEFKANFNYIQESNFFSFFFRLLFMLNRQHCIRFDGILSWKNSIVMYRRNRHRQECFLYRVYRSM